MIFKPTIVKNTKQLKSLWKRFLQGQVQWKMWHFGVLRKTKVTLINRNNLLITKITLTCTEIPLNRWIKVPNYAKLCFYNILIMFTWVFSSILPWHLLGHAIKSFTCFDLQCSRSTRSMTSFCIFIAYINTEGILFNVKITRWD